MKPAYYNEHDLYAAQWLRNLIDAGHIAAGDVDTRSIEDVKPDDLKPYAQCHFFAGLGGWSLALRRAGWADDRAIWTGSCPCQPFSAAGEGMAFADERHLWPAFFHLITQRNPSVVVGEQVASKDADAWIDLVQADMEALGHAFGAVAFPSASIGAPHIRDRTYWLAHTRGARLPEQRGGRNEPKGLAANRIFGGVADDASGGRREERADDRGRPIEDSTEGLAAGFEYGRSDLRPGPTNGLWRDVDWLGCRDGKWRPVEPGTFPLAHGAPARVGRLRAYGNAINVEAARIFIEASGLVDHFVNNPYTLTP